MMYGMTSNVYNCIMYKRKRFDAIAHSTFPVELEFKMHVFWPDIVLKSNDFLNSRL